MTLTSIISDKKKTQDIEKTTTLLIRRDIGYRAELLLGPWESCVLSKDNLSLFITLKINILWIFFKTEASEVQFNKR